MLQGRSVLLYQNTHFSSGIAASCLCPRSNGEISFYPSLHGCLSLFHQWLEGGLIHTTLEVSREGKITFSSLPFSCEPHLPGKRLMDVFVIEWESRANGRS